MNKNFYLILLSTTFFYGAAMAEDGTCGVTDADCHWDLTNSILTISGTGAMKWYKYSDYPWYSSKDSVTKVVIEDGITSIKDYAFSNMGSVTSLTIPKSVTSIGNNAFSYMSGVTSLVIPDSVTFISDSAFLGVKPSNLTISAENLQRYLKVVHGRFKDTGDLSIDCITGDCKAVLEAWDDTNGTNYSSLITIKGVPVIVSNADGSISTYIDGKLTQTVNSDGSTTLYNEDGTIKSYKNKRIYTVKEAEAVSKPTDNTFKLRYK